MRFLLDEADLRHVLGIHLLQSSSQCAFGQRDQAVTNLKSVVSSLTVLQQTWYGCLLLSTTDFTL